MLGAKSLDRIKESADYILDKIGDKVDIGVILGTGTTSLLDDMEEKIIMPYSEIPGFLVTTNKSHPGNLIYGSLNGKKVICMSGRFHYYEGYEFHEIALPIYVLKIIGVKSLIMTNAAGAINYNMHPGDIVIISDHINLSFASPTRGPQIEELGDRFYPIDNLYTKKYRDLAQKCAIELGFSLKEGVYFYAIGPHFETPSEIRAMRILGGDVVGMSTVPEALTAGHAGIKILALSIATNYSSDRVSNMDGSEVESVAALVSKKMRLLIESFISKI